MSYGIVAWGQAAQVHVNKLLILQKRALRLMYFKSNIAHAIPLFISSRFLPLNMLYYKAVSTLMYNVSNNSSPCKITELFTYSKEIHTHNIRFGVLDNFHIKPSRINIKNVSFARLGAMIWNSISPVVRKLGKQALIIRYVIDTPTSTKLMAEQWSL